MKTLTLFRAFMATQSNISFYERAKQVAYSPEDWVKQSRKVVNAWRQRVKFRRALLKRHQEQEERLVATNYLIDETIYALCAGNIDNEEISKDVVEQTLRNILRTLYPNQFEKEKTNE